MTLKERIADMQEELIPQLPDEALQTLQETTQELVQQGLSETAVGKGDPAPGFDLPVSAGDKRDNWNLSLALETGPVVLSFYRGGW
jgi:hypothetical protein